MTTFAKTILTMDDITPFELFGPHTTDGYKLGHRSMYPDGINMLYINETPRTDKLFRKSTACSSMYDGRVLVTGHTAAFKEVAAMWHRSFFSKPKEEVIAKFQRRCNTYVGSGKVSSDSLENLHDIGFLPLNILAVPEGTRLPMGKPAFVCYDNNGKAIDEGSEFFWLVEYLETVFSSITWKQITVGTIAYEYRRVLSKFALLTGTPMDFVKVQVHDFSFRGHGGPEDAARQGATHQRVLFGTDNMPGIDYNEQMYRSEGQVIATTIPATEHSVATTNILHILKKRVKDAKADGMTDEVISAVIDDWRLEAEYDFIVDMVTRKFPTGFLGLVCDSFNFWGVIDMLPRLKEIILARQPDESGFAKIVIRPDSGYPVDVICGVEIFEESDLPRIRKQWADNAEEGAKLYYRVAETGAIKRLVRLPRDGRVTHRISELRERLNESDREYFNEQLAVLGVGNDERFPIGIDITDIEVFNAYSNAAAVLDGNGISVMIHGKGTYKFGYVVQDVERLTTEEKGAIEAMWEVFGGTTTSEGYKQLHERIGLIYGDGITVQRTEEIMRRLVKKGFASGNVVLGVGSYTYNYMTRDTHGTAVKATAARIGDELLEVYKDPMTDSGLKRSAKGLLKLVLENGNIELAQQQDMKVSDLQDGSGLLQPLYIRGEWHMNPTHGEIVAIIDQHIAEDMAALERIDEFDEGCEDRNERPLRTSSYLSGLNVEDLARNTGAE